MVNVPGLRPPTGASTETTRRADIVCFERPATLSRHRCRPPGPTTAGCGRVLLARLVEQQIHQLHAAHAVGEHVVGPEVQRDATTGEALDEGDVPRGSGRIERMRLDQPDQVERLTQLPGVGHHEVAHVVDDVVVVPVHPGGPGAAA